jgi:prepilin-type N-terminal cleavage/methylation domain-containing protein
MKTVGGFTLVELLVVLAIIAIVASIGMAGYRNARVRGNETAAAAGLTAINQAQFSYAQICGGGKYAPTLAALGAPMPTSGQAFLSPDLAAGESVEKSGYQFTMAGTAVEEAKPTCTGVTPLETYQATADPVTPGFSGLRFFGTNTDRVIYADSATFLKNMPETGAPAHGAEIK